MSARHVQFIPKTDIFGFPLVARFLTAVQGEQRLWVRGWGYGLIWKNLLYDSSEIKSQMNVAVCVA